MDDQEEVSLFMNDQEAVSVLVGMIAHARGGFVRVAGAERFLAEVFG